MSLCLLSTVLHNSTEEDITVTFNDEEEDLEPGDSVCVPASGTHVTLSPSNLAYVVHSYRGFGTVYWNRLSYLKNEFTVTPYYIATESYITVLKGLSIGGPGEGTTSYIDKAKVRSITYSHTTEDVLLHSGPHVFSTKTNVTDLPFTITLIHIINMITVTGRSSEGAFVVSYATARDMYGKVIPSLLSSSVTPGITITEEVYEGSTFSIKSNVEAEWVIYVVIG